MANIQEPNRDASSAGPGGRERGGRELFSLSRNDAVEFRVERATGPLCRATGPTPVRTTRLLNGEGGGAFDSAASCRRARASGPFPPDPIESFRLGRIHVVGLDGTGLGGTSHWLLCRNDARTAEGR